MMNRSTYIIPTLVILLILLILAVLTSTIYYTYSIGRIKSVEAIPLNPGSPSTSPNTPVKLADRYPDQVHIMDGILLFGMVIVAVILFDTAWGWQIQPRKRRRTHRK
jgi:hypothetical protein